jgi:hypothetical protein
LRTVNQKRAFFLKLFVSHSTRGGSK